MLLCLWSMKFLKSIKMRKCNVQTVLASMLQILKQNQCFALSPTWQQ